MGLNRKFRDKLENTMFYKWYKKLPVAAVGVVAFFAIMGILTIIFNWYWSGLGADDRRHFILPLTTDNKEFIEYTTLYIYLLSFGATMFAGLAVFLVFNDWKEQKQYEITKELMIEVNTILSDMYIKIGKAINLAQRLKEIDKEKIILQSFINAKELRNIDDLNKIYSFINLYSNITGDKLLMNYKEKFDADTFNMSIFLTKLEKSYSDYFKLLDLKIESNFTIMKTYGKDEKTRVEKQVEDIKKILGESMSFSSNKTHYELSFEESKTNFEKSYKDFIFKISIILKP